MNSFSRRSQLLNPFSRPQVGAQRPFLGMLASGGCWLSLKPCLPQPSLTGTFVWVFRVHLANPGLSSHHKSSDAMPASTHKVTHIAKAPRGGVWGGPGDSGTTPQLPAGACYKDPHSGGGHSIACLISRGLGVRGTRE